MPTLDLARELARAPVNSAAAAVVGPAGVLAIHETGERYRWASVTKIATALTILDACQEGAVSLDDPVEPPGATLGHLLAHTAGYTFDGPDALSRPGVKRIYSNTGINLAADHLTAATGTAFENEMNDRVLELLDMEDARLEGPPSHGMVGTVTDLARMAQELLSPRLVLPEVVRLASTPVFPEVGGVTPGFGRYQPNLWGCGCEVKGEKTPHWTAPGNSPATFGHFGMSGSFCWVDPEARLACVFLGDRDFGAWAPGYWPQFATKVLDAFGA